MHGIFNLHLKQFEYCSGLLCGCSIPAGCRCWPCPRNDDKSAQCVYDAIFYAARSLCQSSGNKVPQLLIKAFLLRGGSALTTAVTRLPSPVGEVWRRVHVG